ncbi:MAG: GNAT family N-acetyltransferase [Planctomycetes bacterium]|nr:GNAT family N-acetyltransferase [Planctomycetota bacterium]
MTDHLSLRYPKTVTLKGRAVVLRPLQRKDEQPLLEFFKRLPVDERQMLKDDVTSPEVIGDWCRHLDYERTLPILGWSGSRVVANSTLHRHRGGWMGHVAKFRITVDPEFRGCGLARTLTQEIVDLAVLQGVAIIDAEAMAEQKGVIRLLESLDFIAVATLPQHVLDLTYQPHDLVILSRTVIPVERLSPDAKKSVEEVDVGGGG